MSLKKKNSETKTGACHQVKLIIGVDEFEWSSRMMTILSIINVLVTYLFQVNFYIGITTPINTVIIIILINDVDADDDEMMVMTMMMV